MKRLIFILSLSSLFANCIAQTQNVQVLQYHPAPGQFINAMPEVNQSMSHQEVCAIATDALNNEQLINLGAFGGYVTVKFDHPIQNKEGSDFRITGNSFYSMSSNPTNLGGSFEPGIVYVGVGTDPETCKWYELAGSEYYKDEIHDFTITYHKPTAESGEHALPFSVNDNYIKWEASWTENGERKDSTGYHMKISSHSQTFWPMWENSDILTFTGGRLPDNGIDTSGKGTFWVLYRYSEDSFGYADASLNNDEYSTFDIDWAVDENGNHVNLNEINFIKVKTGVFQYCGWCGETSTEISGFKDLHLVEGYDKNPIVIKQATPTNVISSNNRETTENNNIFYDLYGRKISNPKHGIFIRNNKKIIIQ